MTNTIAVQGDANWVYHAPVHFQAEMQRREGGWRYEFRIDVQSMTHGQARLRPGGKVELNVGIHDLDRWGPKPNEQQSKTLEWVVGNSLRRLSGRGDLLLVGEGAPVGRLSGQVKLWDGGIPGTWKRVRIEPDATPGSVVHALTERDGRFEVDLPAGCYRVAVNQRSAEPPGAEAVVIAGGAETRVDLVAPSVVGQTFQAVPARVQSAGRGSRRGAWRTYGVADGLPAASVTAIVQDGRGELWLGTDGGGLARFDGARFYVYSMGDILGGDRVARVVEDPRGRLWLTAREDQPGEGIACLDRNRGRFIAYTSQDGLQNGREDLLVLDPQGHLCVADDFGVARLDPDRGQFVHFSSEDGLPGILIGSFALSRKGCLYIGPWFSGEIGRWEGERFTSFDLPAAVRLVVHMHEDRTGSLWVAAQRLGGKEDQLLWRTGDEGKTWPAKRLRPCGATTKAASWSQRMGLRCWGRIGAPCTPKK